MTRSERFQSGWVQTLAQLTVMGVSSVFLTFQFVENWRRIQTNFATLRWSALLCSTLGLVLARYLLPLPTYLSLKAAGMRVPYREALAIFNASQLVKYLPGGFWALPGRVLMYQRRYGMKASLGAVSVMVETGALLAAALVIGCLSIPMLSHLPIDSGWLFLLGGIILVTLVPLLQSRVVRVLTRSNWFPIRTLTETIRMGMDFGLVSRMTLASLPFWLLTGLAFSVLVRAAMFIKLPWYQGVGTFALSWAVGFMVVIVPAGFGVREAMIVMLLSANGNTRADAVFISLLARLWWSFAEGIWILMGFILMNTDSKRHSSLPQQDRVSRMFEAGE
jgi:glycosyltransferase 2 family protein